jgi:hypothetical protein
LLCFPHHEDDPENEHSNEKVGEDFPHEIQVDNLHLGHLFYGGTIPLSMNPPEMYRFCSVALLQSCGQWGEGSGIRDEKGETVTFSKILTIFYDYVSIPSVERL